ncbi:MAG TPA: hypothetical protein VF077_07320, partial [Nitrospiraceae bacterium]
MHAPLPIMRACPTGHARTATAATNAGRSKVMRDPTETLRRVMLESGHPQRACAAADRRWDSDQLRAEFEVLAFA